jgi:hypothetical protein
MQAVNLIHKKATKQTMKTENVKFASNWIGLANRQTKN